MKLFYFDLFMLLMAILDFSNLVRILDLNDLFIEMSIGWIFFVNPFGLITCCEYLVTYLVTFSVRYKCEESYMRKNLDLKDTNYHFFDNSFSFYNNSHGGYLNKKES